MIRTFLARLFGNPTPGVRPAPAVPSADPIRAEDNADFDWDTLLPTPQEVATLRAFTLTISAHLGPQASNRIADQVTAYFSDPDLLDNGPYACRDSALQQGAHECCLQVPWKGAHELALRANALLAEHGVQERWCWDPEGDATKVREGLGAFADWAGGRGLALLHLGFEGDIYYAFLVASGEAQQVLDLARAAELPVSTDAAFQTR